LTHRCHAVLAAVSHGYPPPKDRYLRVTHPSATDNRSCPCDLHVLSMPPAFALSQDQTLRFIQPIHAQVLKTQTYTSQTNRPQTHHQIRPKQPRNPRGENTQVTPIQNILSTHPKDTPAAHPRYPRSNPEIGTRANRKPHTQTRPNIQNNYKPSHQSSPSKHAKQ